MVAEGHLTPNKALPTLRDANRICQSILPSYDGGGSIPEYQHRNMHYIGSNNS